MSSRINSVWMGAAMLALAPAGVANAATVYDNGGPNHLSGSEASQFNEAEDFALTSAGSIGGATLYAIDQGALAGASLQYAIYADDGGTPGATLASGNAVNLSVTGTGVPVGSFTESLVTFDFASAFAAAANTTYWFGIHFTDGFDRQEIYFESANGNGTSLGMYGGPGNWNSNGLEHSFTLVSAAAGPAVPEPATWALMALGFGGLGLSLRRNKRQATATA